MLRPTFSLLVLLGAGCGASSTAYRAHFDSEPEVAALRECAARCDAASAQGEDVHRCLRSCPGMSAHPGDRCNAGTLQPGTYCVTVEERIRPDADFWFAVAEVAVEAAAERNSHHDDDDDDGEQAREKPSSRASSPEHRPARPSASPRVGRRR